MRDKAVLTTGQVARICKVAPRTATKWFDSGQLRGYRIPGSKDRRIPLPNLREFLKKNQGMVNLTPRCVVICNSTLLLQRLRQATADECEFSAHPSFFEAGLAAAEGVNFLLVDVQGSLDCMRATIEAIRKNPEFSSLPIGLYLPPDAPGDHPLYQMVQDRFRQPMDPELIALSVASKAAKHQASILEAILHQN